MAYWFVMPSSGSDSNDGKDTLGFALTAATFTNATKTLTKTGAFSSYTFTAGDRIAITGGTGVTAGLYEIASKTDSDNIVLVLDIGGTNPSDVTSSSGPWLTTQFAADTVTTAGDCIYLCNEAVETISAKIDIDTNPGTDSATIKFIGADTQGYELTDGSRYEISTSSVIAAMIEYGIAADYTEWRHVKFNCNANAVRGLYNSTADGVIGTIFINCRFTDANGGSGINIRGTGTDRDGWNFFDCETDTNDLYGIQHSSAARAVIHWHGGSIHDNGSDGWSINRAGCYIFNALVYDNGGDGLSLGANSADTTILNCTIYGNTGDGIQLDNPPDSGGIIAGNTIAGNGGYGINTQSGGFGSQTYVDYNHYYNNTSGECDVTTPGIHNQSGNPLFTSVVDGSENFAPTTGSPLIGTNMNGGNIGAVAHASGGGGGVVKLVGCGGGLVG